RAARAGHALALQPELMRFTVDAITGLAFGHDVRSLEGDDDVIQRHLDQIFPALFRRIIAPLPTWRWWPGAADRALARSVAAVDEAIAGFIAQARQRLHDEPSRRERPPNLLEAMLVAASTPGAEVDDGDVKGNVLNMLLAGEDTTANTLAWMLHLLVRHPPLLQRAQDEVRAVAGAAPEVTLEQLDALRFVEACMHETMRLKPVAPFNVLQALRETVVGDVRVAPGTLVWCVLRHDSLQPRHFVAPDEFRPQRWLEGDGAPAAAAASAKRVAMPFGAGPRICPGRYLAMLEMKLVMATLLGSFDIVSLTAPGGAEAAERMAFTMAPVGLEMRLRERA
ncbi:MAG: cytochrome P450, partial [Burkholderiales bacterium]|nr:cytochrome P450 [Burkholderiales bacterium]